MRIRPYIAEKDFEYLRSWITDERIHALWCANRIPYPLSSEGLNDVLAKNSMDWNSSAFVATKDSGEPIGFFCYSLKEENSTGLLTFVVIDDSLRGKDYGKEMMRLALKYAYDISGATSVRLNVFDINAAAKRCYESVGFVESSITKDAFSFQDERWGRCNMVALSDTMGNGPT